MTWRLPKLEDEIDFLSKFFPMWIYLVATMAVSTQCVTFFASQLGDLYLAALGAAYMIQMGTLYCFMQGYTSVMDVYGPQLVGRGEKGKLGKLTVKVLLQGTLTFVLIMPLWIGLIFALRLFHVAGEVGNNDDGSLREVMEYFLLACTVCSLLDFYIETLMKFFANQGTMRTVYAMSIGQTVLQVFLCFIFVTLLELHVDGIILAIAMTRIIVLSCSALLCYIKRSEWELRGLIDANTWKNWGVMVWCGLTSGTSIFFLYVSYTVANIVVQPLGREAVESMSLLMQFESFIAPSSFALVYTSALQVGKALGEGDPDKIKSLIGLNLFNLLVERIIITVVFFTLFRIYLEILTSDAAVIELSISTTPIYVASMCFAALIELLGRGILIVFGKTGLVSGIVIFGSVVVGIPVILILVYLTHAGVKGIILAILVENIIEVVIFAGILISTNLLDEAGFCEQRLEKLSLREASEHTEIDYESLKPDGSD